MVPATLLAFLASPAAGAEAARTVAIPRPCDQVPGLQKAFVAVTTLRAAYTDSKEIALLDAPLVSRGRIFYQRPDRLHMATESPSRQAVTLVGNRVKVVQQDLGRQESMDLGTSDVAKAVVSNILLVLGGRIDTLSDLYRCTAAPDADDWRLELVPLREPMTKVVRRMQVRVAGDGTLREVRVEEPDGDASTMTFTGADANRPFTDEEVRSYFSP